MAHRKVDIDTLLVDEDEFIEKEVSISVSYQDLEAQTMEKQNNIRQALSRNDIPTALKFSLQDPPKGSAEIEPLKVICMQNVFSVLSNVKSNDIPVLVKSLVQDEIDVLLKYLYRGMASPNDFNSGVLLAW
jgi:actin related protein 2/3 complex subunit 5